MKNTCLFPILICAVYISLILSGCVNSNNTTSASPTPTPALYPVVFHINNNTTNIVAYVGLVRNSTAETFSQNCSIPGGYAVNVAVNIPANDAYNVTIGQGPGYANDIWQVFSLAINTTYTANIQGASSSLSTAACNTCQF